MTRPGGVTPRGLPYPGSGAAHADTPAALQALADAISSQLGSVAGGVELKGWAGNVTLDGNASVVLTFAGYQVLGGICQLTSHMGGSGSPGWASGVDAGGRVVVTDVNQWIESVGSPSFRNKIVGLMAVVWVAPAV
jgi:hypothetical protein